MTNRYSRVLPPSFFTSSPAALAEPPESHNSEHMNSHDSDVKLPVAITSSTTITLSPGVTESSCISNMS